MKDTAMPHVHVLENEVLILNHTRFLVTTAWTDYSSTGDVVPAKRAAWESMNDFVVIRADESFRRLSPNDLIAKSKAAYAWLTEELEKPFDGKTVVVTHHAPALDHMGDELPDDLIPAYANDWPELLSKADLWVYGHTHVAADFLKNGCRVVSNPRGYPNQKTGFDPDFLVEI
jgi:predicted phosphodiesterase